MSSLAHTANISVSGWVEMSTSSTATGSDHWKHIGCFKILHCHFNYMPCECDPVISVNYVYFHISLLWGSKKRQKLFSTEVIRQIQWLVLTVMNLIYDDIIYFFIAVFLLIVRNGGDPSLWLHCNCFKMTMINHIGKNRIFHQNKLRSIEMLHLFQYNEFLCIPTTFSTCAAVRATSRDRAGTYSADAI